MRTMAVPPSKGITSIKIFLWQVPEFGQFRLKTPARRNATVKVIRRPKISETKRNQVGAQLATD